MIKPLSDNRFSSDYSIIESRKLNEIKALGRYQSISIVIVVVGAILFAAGVLLAVFCGALSMPTVFSIMGSGLALLLCGVIFSLLCYNRKLLIKSQLPLTFLLGSIRDDCVALEVHLAAIEEKIASFSDENPIFKNQLSPGIGNLIFQLKQSFQEIKLGVDKADILNPIEILTLSKKWNKALTRNKELTHRISKLITLNVLAGSCDTKLRLLCVEGGFEKDAEAILQVKNDQVLGLSQVFIEQILLWDSDQVAVYESNFNVLKSSLDKDYDILVSCQDLIAGGLKKLVESWKITAESLRSLNQKFADRVIRKNIKSYRANLKKFKESTVSSLLREYGAVIEKKQQIDTILNLPETFQDMVVYGEFNKVCVLFEETVQQLPNFYDLLIEHSILKYNFDLETTCYNELSNLGYRDDGLQSLIELSFNCRNQAIEAQRTLNKLIPDAGFLMSGILQICEMQSLSEKIQISEDLIAYSDQLLENEQIGCMTVDKGVVQTRELVRRVRLLMNKIDLLRIKKNVDPIVRNFADYAESDVDLSRAASGEHVIFVNIQKQLHRSITEKAHKLSVLEEQLRKHRNLRVDLQNQLNIFQGCLGDLDMTIPKSIAFPGLSSWKEEVIGVCQKMEATLESIDLKANILSGYSGLNIEFETCLSSLAAACPDERNVKKERDAAVHAVKEITDLKHRLIPLNCMCLIDTLEGWGGEIGESIDELDNNNAEAAMADEEEEEVEQRVIFWPGKDVFYV